jgi:uncharacterized membrane protein YdbT with pleckstrin-like domain
VAFPPPPGRRPALRYLLPNEALIVAVRRHPVVLLRYVVEVIAAMVIAGTVARGLDGRSDDIIWWAFLAFVARAIWMAVEWANDRFIVTDRRVMLVTGLVTRKVAMMPLIRVTDLTYERPMPGRLLGYGTFVFESAGQDQALHRVAFLPSPDLLYRDVGALIFRPPVVPPPPVLPKVVDPD